MPDSGAVTTEKRDALAAFANDVLNLLEADQDWDSGTLDNIGALAEHYGLSTLDGEGMFKRKNA